MTTNCAFFDSIKLVTVLTPDLQKLKEKHRVKKKYITRSRTNTIFHKTDQSYGERLIAWFHQKVRTISQKWLFWLVQPISRHSKPHSPYRMTAGFFVGAASLPATRALAFCLSRSRLWCFVSGRYLAISLNTDVAESTNANPSKPAQHWS